MKTALITGITSQDGAYLARLLLSKGYTVYGGYRRTSTPNFWRLDELGITDRVRLICMEITDQSSLQSMLERIRPTELYNLGAQSFVATSFEQPIFTGDINALSVTRLLEAVRTQSPETRFYQASTSEMFGKVKTVPQTEATPFHPRSPYGVAKLYGHWITVNYRESYNLYACSGILFNHESPLRGISFVTRKITAGLSAVKLGTQECLQLGNLEAKRDWGFAGEYVEGMWKMLQQDTPDDYVLATGRANSVREFIELVAQALDFNLGWEGKGKDEVGVDKTTGKVIIRINPEHYRPAEVDLLIGDASKARKELGWESRMKLETLVQNMVNADLTRQGGTPATLKVAKVS